MPRPFGSDRQRRRVRAGAWVASHTVCLLRGIFVDKRKILIQLDSDPHASVFDRVVAVDAGAEEIFSYGGVKPEQVQGLVHGAIFTRGPNSLKSTAIFVG